MANKTFTIVTEAIHEAGMKPLLETPGFDVHVIKNYEDSELLAKADAILTRLYPFTEADLARAPNLKFFSKHGVGVSHLPLDAVKKRGITVAVVGDLNSRAVAETIFSMIIANAKNTIAVDRAMRDDDYAIRSRQTTRELGGKTILLLGLGRIGSRVAKYCNAFDMNVLGYDPVLKPEEIEARGCKPISDWRAVLGELDYISFQVPLIPETTNMFGPKELAALKKDAVLINCARGGIVDEHALAEAAASGAIRGAGVDATVDEPVYSDHPLLSQKTFGKIILSPHLAALSLESSLNMARVSAQNIIDFFNGRLDPNLIYKL